MVVPSKELTGAVLLTLLTLFVPVAASTLLSVCFETQRSYVCPVENCGRQYKRRDHLNRHSLTHSGSLFACTWEGCDATFNVKSNLERHLRVHEKWGADVLRGSKRVEACLTCPEHGCGKSFKYPSLLKTHLENVHGEAAS